MGLNIILEYGDLIYRPGDVIRGVAEHISLGPTKVKGVIVKMLGIARTAWLGEESYTAAHGDRLKRPVKIHGDEEYINLKYFLIGQEHSADDIYLPPGQCSYPFEFVLPPNIPSSHEGKWGYVRYTVMVALHQPWTTTPLTTILLVKVQTPFDLNDEEFAPLREPQRIEIEKTFCCWCCASGPMYINADLPGTGFVPGQLIPINVECENSSNTTILNLKIFLKKKETFRSLIPRVEVKEELHDVRTIELGVIHPRVSKNFSTVLKIPKLTSSDLRYCGIIDVAYSLQIWGEVGLAHFEPEKVIDIIIGTVPLRSFSCPMEAPLDPDPNEKDEGKGDENCDHMDEDNKLLVKYNQAIAKPGDNIVGWNLPLNPSSNMPLLADGARAPSPSFPPMPVLAPYTMQMPHLLPAQPASNPGYAPSQSPFASPTPPYPPADSYLSPSGSGYPPGNPGYPNASVGYSPKPGYPVKYSGDSPAAPERPKPEYTSAPPPSYEESQQFNSSVPPPATAPPMD